MSPEIKQQFSQFFLLYKLVEEYPINVLLEGDEKYLETTLETLTGKGLISIDDHYYQVTGQGRDAYQNFMKRYSDFLINFDVYCGVDLSSGEFAFEKYWKLEEEDWKRHLSQERFEDLRITVARHKGVVSEEIVFMSFINEDRFDKITSTPGWQFDLASGAAWQEIDAIIKSVITVEQLAYQDGNDYIKGELVLSDIISAGARLNQSLWQNETQYFQEEYDLEVNTKSLESYLDEKYSDPIWKKKLI